MKIQSSWFKSGSGAPAFLSRPYQEVLTREARATIDDVWGVDAVVFNYTFDVENCETPSATTSPTTPGPTPGALGSDGATTTRSVAFCLVTIFLGAALSW